MSISLRNHFAGLAMQAIISTDRAQDFVDENGDDVGMVVGVEGTLFIHTKFLIKEAYMIADAMLEATKL